MVSEAILTLVQFGIMFALTVVFSLVALDRKSVVSNGLACLLWVAFAIMNFMIGYTLFGSMLSFLIGLIGFIFAGTFIKELISGWLDAKHARFEF